MTIKPDMTTVDLLIDESAFGSDPVIPHARSE